ncbi:CaiB/BaiF CoA transferase family protein [Paraburkholderia oxyphila]|uniref:CaiB/BaiF CoA transferase family protein n=1 Tax=Paraburkholderia oxyphila TaxID=614212 RepID=UPI000488F6FF|nr:CoA transferase [Paraburkholderia oxyphila]
MNKLPLEGIRIADFTWIGAGSFTTKLFADHGADVIKVESADRLDALRGSRPYAQGVPGVNRSGYFADRNSNKKSITLNLKTAEGQELARQLIETSDIVANNFTPGTMEKFGLGYEAVKKIRPDAIYLAMSMQGSSGPEHKYLGFGLTIGALTGLQFLSGLPDKEPAGTGTNFPDHIPNPCHAAFAVLAALRHRRRTGQGQYIDVAQTEPTVALLGPTMMDCAANGNVGGRMGNRHPATAPHGVYPCQGVDRWIAISAGTEAAWSGLVAALPEADGLRAAQFSTAHDRKANGDELDAALAQATSRYEADALMARLQRHGVPAGVVRSAEDIVERDLQLQHRQHWVRLQHPEMGEAIYNAPPFRISGHSETVRWPAPLLGQHTEEVCRDVFGMDEAGVASLRLKGVLT